jgi:hypothetical protein
MVKEDICRLYKHRIALSTRAGLKIYKCIVSASATKTTCNTTQEARAIAMEIMIFARWKRRSKPGEIW